MKKTYRQILLLVSIVFFLSLAPLLVLYALGYRLNSSMGKSEPVGVIVVESNPRRAQTYINSKYQGHTPQSIPNISPGLLDISITKEGYVPWTKRLKVFPSQVTEARDIRLFPKKIHRRTLLSDIAFFSLSPNRKYIAATSSANTLYLINDEGEQLFSPVQLAQPANKILWSPDSAEFIIFSNYASSLIDLDDFKPQKIILPSFNLSGDIAWDQRIPNRLLYLNNSNQLIAYNLSSGNTQVIAENISTFATSARHIITISLRNEINWYNLQGVVTDALTLNDSLVIKQLYVTPEGNMAALAEDDILLLFSKEKTFFPIAHQVKKTGWSPDGQLLYIQSEETALHVYNVNDEGLSYLPLNFLQLVIRLSRPIRDPQWYAGGRHLIYQVDDQIIITEIDTRDHPISFTVDSTNLGASQHTVGANGNTLFYLKHTGLHPRLVKANLTVEK